ncbi:MAG: acyl-CoA dehydrogenase C-terminal domain-containing protein [Acidiferrobacterales bacterium]
MAIYHAPVRDMRFVYHELLESAALHGLPGYEDATPDVVDAVLEQAGKLCENVLLPINRSGDEEGCRLEDGVVKTPAGFKEAYRTFAEGGWTAIVGDPTYGGQGLPHTVNILVQEMICSTNLSFGIYPGLSYGAYHAIHAHGSEALKQTYLPKLVDGTWSGTMCLTEPQCGTDLGMVRTRAVPQDDGTYKITGTKIFISAGDHDLTENIIHLVLARTPDAPAGIKGISLFLVPKMRVNGTNNVTGANGVSCGALEHKMGIKASSTCVINFEESTGFLIGELNKGMRAMFTMMNAARLQVGMQGLGLAEAAYQNATAYARERIQGRSLNGSKHTDKPADPIIVHPDVRRMLLTMRAYTEGGRALAGWIAIHLDVIEKHPDPEKRREAEDLVALLTPIAKAFFTDTGFEMTNLGLQVFGGHGYIREHGIEQYVRDARITQLYEGTNGVQALDLVGRKLPAHMGRYLRRFFHPVSEFIEAHDGDSAMQEFVVPLAKAFGRLQRATGWIAQQGLRDPEEAGAAATDYLRLFGFVALAYVWARTAEIALEQRDGDNTGFYDAKLRTARFFMQKLLPQTSGLFAAIMAGACPVMEFDAAAF